MAFVAPLALLLSGPPRRPRPSRSPPTRPFATAFRGLPCLRPLRPAALPPSQTWPHMICSTALPDTSPAPAPPPPSPPRKRSLTLVALLLLLLCGGVLLLSRVANPGLLLSSLAPSVAALGPLRGALLLGAVNFCTVLFCFPANMGLMIGAGALLGPLPAFAALFCSKLLAASAAFTLARGVLYARARTWLKRYSKLEKVLTETGRDGGWKFVLLMRLSPFPGFLLNYLLSMTGVGFAEYLGGTVIGITPSILNLVLVGATARDVGVGVSGGTVQGGWFGIALKALCMVSMVIVSVVVTRKARKAFADADEVQPSDTGDMVEENVPL